MTTPPPVDPIVGLDPNDLPALLRRVAELQAQGNAASAGGAVFQASVYANRDVIGRDLYQVIVQAAPTGMGDSQARELIVHYLRAQVLPLATLKLGEIDPGLDTAQHSALQLRDVYVPLNTSHRLPQGATLARPQARAAGKRSRKSADPGEPGQFVPATATNSVPSAPWRRWPSTAA